MRPAAPFVFLAFLSACSSEANHLGNPLLLPISGISTAIGNAAYAERRGQMEVLVKTQHPALIADIENGGGATLTQAFDISGVPANDRPARITQLQGDLALYDTNLEALIVALMVYGG